jgi:hypothetical protein
MRKLRTDRQRIARVVTSDGGILAPLNRLPRSKRTLELLELVRTLQEVEREEGILAVERRPSWNGNDVKSGVVAPTRLYRTANQILSVCHWSPRIHRPPGQSNSFTWNARTEKSDWENGFVFWLLNLRARGDVSLIRCCRNCGRWFYATTNHQTFCEDRCRQQFHSKDQDFKKQRRLYMRGYRKNERARGLAARERILNKDRGSNL